MNILLYTPAKSGQEEYLQGVIEQVASRAEIEICHTLENLTHRLSHLGHTPQVAVLNTTRQEDYYELFSVRELLASTSVILILPDREETTIAQGHTLRPRFLTFADSDPRMVGAVLDKMLRRASQGGAKDIQKEYGMRVLIAEDEFTSRILLKEILSLYGDCDIAVNGEEAVHAFRLAWEGKSPYDLICMDIIMPNLDGQKAMEKIREIENELGVTDKDRVKAIVISALDDSKTVVKAMYKGAFEGYLIKPVSEADVFEELRILGLIDDDEPEPEIRP